MFESFFFENISDTPPPVVRNVLILLGRFYLQKRCYMSLFNFGKKKSAPPLEMDSAPLPSLDNLPSPETTSFQPEQPLTSNIPSLPIPAAPKMYPSSSTQQPIVPASESLLNQPEDDVLERLIPNDSSKPVSFPPSHPDSVSIQPVSVPLPVHPVLSEPTPPTIPTPLPEVPVQPIVSEPEPASIPPTIPTHPSDSSLSWSETPPDSPPEFTEDSSSSLPVFEEVVPQRDILNDPKEFLKSKGMSLDSLFVEKEQYAKMLSLLHETVELEKVFAIDDERYVKLANRQAKFLEKASAGFMNVNKKLGIVEENLSRV